MPRKRREHVPTEEGVQVHERDSEGDQGDGIRDGVEWEGDGGIGIQSDGCSTSGTSSPAVQDLQQHGDPEGQTRECDPDVTRESNSRRRRRKKANDQVHRSRSDSVDVERIDSRDRRQGGTTVLRVCDVRNIHQSQ